MTDQKRTPDPSGPETPDLPGSDGMKKIKPVDLSLHGDGVSHWQDEPEGGADQRQDEDAAKP